MKKYKVLWIDDEYEKLSALMERCELMHDFEIVKRRYAKSGMEIFEKNLYDWSAVILDAKVLMESDNEIANLSGLRYSRDYITALSSKRHVPMFVFTGQPDLISNEMFEMMVNKYYSKGDDDDQLIEDIKTEANKQLETQIRNKYSDVLELWPEVERDLIKILLVIETDDTNNGSVLNDVRKILEFVMRKFYSIGLLQIEFTDTNLAECSRFLGQKFMTEIIPAYVQRSLHACVSVSNSGSHGSELDKVIKKGKAPYVLRSTIFELLNVLEWYGKLPKDAELIYRGVQELVKRNCKPND